MKLAPVRTGREALDVCVSGVKVQSVRKIVDCPLALDSGFPHHLLNGSKAIEHTEPL